MDPQKRKESPDFYGYSPDGGGRALIFGCMMLNSALLLLMRSLSAAMLMLVEKRYLLVYMAGDMALYLLQKVLRGDFQYWIPVDGAFGLFVSLLVRVGIKNIVDFTGVVHYRSPQELGGLYFTANMFLALLASVASVWVYIDKGGGEVTERVAFSLVGYLGGCWSITFGLFLLLMKKEYRRTFFTVLTAKQATMDKFKIDDEAVKASVLKKNKHHWRVIRGEVKEWVLENYWRWDEEKPTWMTESWLAKLPSDMIPAEAEKHVKGIRDSQRRRSSLLGTKGTKVQPTSN